jgi:predicted AAA+ superfamily ATPase
MFKRDLQPYLEKMATFYPVVALLGPRQSGKTTLAQLTFPRHTYVSLEDLETRRFAQSDPRGFLETYKNEYGIILDEFQHVPELLSYIQTKVDAAKQMGYFILTGSQNFLMNQAISQSLAGRVAITTLLPFSLAELKNNGISPANLQDIYLKGFYPPLYSRSIPADVWYPNYIQTYIERDIRQLAQVTDLSLFQMFMQLCAGRCGQLLNISSLANDCGISDTTARRWLTLLQASYIIYLLPPHHNNLGKRLTKSPKLYFFDIGLMRALLKIPYEQLATHHLKGGFFESLIISDLIKQYTNAGQRPSIYFWRDHVGNEVDCLIEYGTQVIPIEIKSGQTVQNDFYKGLEYYQNLAGASAPTAYIVYGGNEIQKRSKGTVLSWHSIDHLIKPYLSSLT